MYVRRWMIWAAGVVIAAAFGGIAAQAQDTNLKQTLDELLPGMGAEQGFENPQQRWQEICFRAGAPGTRTDCGSEVCTLMAAKVASPSEATPRARVWLLKQLERIGHEECVEAIAPAAADKDRLVRDAAIRALASNPAPAAGEKLEEALKAEGDPRHKVALINALGYRGETSATELLGRELQSENDEVAAAAARALGKLATPGAIEALKAALKSTRGPVRLQVGDALAKCGERLLARGDTAGARAIAELLYQPDQPARLAGLEGLLQDGRRRRGEQDPRGPGSRRAGRYHRGRGLRGRRRQQGSQATGRRADEPAADRRRSPCWVPWGPAATARPCRPWSPPRPARRSR